MFYPVGKETPLRLSADVEEAVVSVRGNRERTLIAAATPTSLFVYLANPHLLLCVFRRSPSEVLEKGAFVDLYWRYDTTTLAVTTQRNHVFLFSVEGGGEACWQLVDSSEHAYQRSSNESFIRDQRPSCGLSLAVVVSLAAQPACVVPLRDEMLVCLRNGFAHRISWTGQLDADYSFQISKVPFAHDQLQSKQEFLSSGCIADAAYAPLIGGFCCVLSDGRAALLTSTDPRFHPNSLLGVWAQQMRDAVCTDVNHKFRMMMFACGNGDVCGYHVDDSNGAVAQTFRVPLTVRDGPELLNRLGPACRLQVLPTGAAFACVWKGQGAAGGGGETNGVIGAESSPTPPRPLPPALAVFSPFGACTWCSLEGVDESLGPCTSFYSCVEWGAEGLELWMGGSGGLSCLPIARSASVNNPVMEHCSRQVLVCGSRVYVAPPRSREPAAAAPHSVWASHAVIGEYLAQNWPIKFVSLCREDEKTLVVAGARGLAHCNTAVGRWKIFGNERQERDWMVTGGVWVWNGTVGAAGCDLSTGKEQIRFYPLTTRLDDRFCSSHDAEARVLMSSMRNDALVTFDIDSRILLYKLRRADAGGKEDPPQVVLERAAEIRVLDLIPHPACLVSIQLTQLNHDAAASQFIPGVDTVLVNVAGRLITLNPRGAGGGGGGGGGGYEDDERFQLNQPVVVASFVECVWHDMATPVGHAHLGPAHLRPPAPQLANALWINCGSKGMRVWLPLFPGRRGSTVNQGTFISKRIMLPFTLDIHPISISSSDCVALGVESVPCVYGEGGGGAGGGMVLHSLNRNSEVFVHHLLRQLLKRNLGVFALELAAACRHLAHFSHALELLLHSVLDEEATSSEPIPDPLLPRAVAFVQEFPEFLQTVVHCARKTELALWPALFAVTASPNDLFEVCLRDGHLQTAASYLIVLQSLENAATSQEQAARLLREALAAGAWSIARDMVRFASCIDAEEMEQCRASPPPAKQKERRRMNGSTGEELVFSRFQASAATGGGKVTRMRHSHSISEKGGGEGNEKAGRKDSAGSGGRRAGRALSSDGSPPGSPPPPAGNPMHDKLQSILHEHAAHLLSEYCVRDLGLFWAHLDVDLPALLPPAATVEDFPLALTRLHSQFRWPYPLAGRRMVDQLAKRFGTMPTSASSAELAVSSSPFPQPRALPLRLGETAVVEREEDEETIGDRSEEGVRLEARRRVDEEGEGTEGGGAGGGGEGRGKAVSSSAEDVGAGGGAQSASSPVEETRSVAGSDWEAVEVLCGEGAARGSPASDAQLMHMMAVFERTGSVHWTYLLCVLRRDLASLRRAVSVSATRAAGEEQMGQLKRGGVELLRWAEGNCLGYVSLLQVFDAHVQAVCDAAGLKIEQLPVEGGGGGGVERRKETASFREPRSSQQQHPRTSALRDSFGVEGRERRGRGSGRSVDRTAVVSNTEAEASECVVM